MTRKLTSTVTGLVGALVLVSSAAATGESKNSTPFTRQATQLRIEAAPTPEAKNQMPFTRRATQAESHAWYRLVTGQTSGTSANDASDHAWYHLLTGQTG
jgi:hypothetical protein